MARPRRLRNQVPPQPDGRVEVAITQYQCGSWTLNQCATYTGYDKSHMYRILQGERRKDAMRAVDPSSCAPTYVQPTKPTACPHCDQGHVWVRYEGRLDGLGRLSFFCPNCGRPA